MGSWGVGIFSNDECADLREDFRDLIGEGMTAEQATERLQDEYGIGSEGTDDNDFWLGLAATQHKLGHVAPAVIERAIAIASSAAELDRWEVSDRRRRKAALDKLSATLKQPSASPKRIRPRSKVDTSLAEGQHVLVPLPGSERSLLLRVTRVQSDKGGRYAVVVVVEWDGSAKKLRRASRLPPMLDPRALRTNEALGFVLIGEPSDPDDLIVLPDLVDRRTPTRPWQSQRITKWSELYRFFGPDGGLQVS